MIGQTAAMHPHILAQAVDYTDELKRLRRERLGLKVVTEEQAQSHDKENEEASLKKGFQRFVDFVAKKPSLAQKKTNSEIFSKRQMMAKVNHAYLQTRDFEEHRKGSGLQLNRKI